jgi:hypothetical protein
VLVALGAAGLLVALWVWPATSLADRLRARAAATVVVADLRASQARAMASRQATVAHGLRFAPGSDRYQIVVRDGSRVVSAAKRMLPAGARISYVRFGGSVPEEALFHGRSLFGAPSGGGTVTVTAGRARVCVRVLPATGRIRVAAAGCP